MSIQLVTYANQTVTPTNDAIIYEKAIDQNGIFYGCNVTVTSNTVNITGGYGMICGREFTIQSESIAVTLAPSGTLQGRLYVRLDLADADAPIQLLTATGNTLPPLEQDDDVNFTNGTYEMELATFTVGVSALSDVAETFETIFGTKKVLESLPLFVEVNVSGTVPALSANTYFSISLTGTIPAGYKPVAVKSFTTGTSNCYIHSVTTNNNGCDLAGRSFNAQSTTASASAVLLCMKIGVGTL